MSAFLLNASNILINHINRIHLIIDDSSSKLGTEMEYFFVIFIFKRKRINEI